MSKKIQAILILFVIVISIGYKILSGIFILIYQNINSIVIITLSGLGVILAYLLYSEIYFRSKKFILTKESISKHTKDCNELNHYIEELKTSYVNIESYNYGTGRMIDNSV